MDPTRMTPWIALVPDISGVCKTLGTFEMTSSPTNAAKIKTVIRPMMSAPFMTVTPSRD